MGGEETPMQAMRKSADGRRWLCMADGCSNPSTVGWARRTTGANITAVEACDTHKVTVAKLGIVHQASCVAPPLCVCP